MTTAIIGTGGIGSAIARLLGGGGEAIRLSGRDTDSARALAADIGPSAAVAAGNADALRGVDAVILALRFTVLQSVIEEVGALLTDKVVIVPSNPLTTDAQGKVVRVLAEGESSGAVVSAWLPTGARLVMAFGTMSAALLGVFEQTVARARRALLRDRRRGRRAGGRAVDPERGVRAGASRRAAPIEPARGGGRSARPRDRAHRCGSAGRRGLAPPPMHPRCVRPPGRPGARTTSSAPRQVRRRSRFPPMPRTRRDG